MFKEIMGKSRHSALVYDALQEVLTMLEHAERMFSAVPVVLLPGKAGSADVSREDREINTGERMVRRMVLEHLILNPQQDLPASLGLISIVHEVERIGDYVKHLVELGRWAELCSGDSQHAQSCRTIHAMIAPLFAQVQAALRESAADKARQAMRRHEEVKERTDVLLEQVMNDTAVSGHEAVVYALVSRYLRRISAHLSNVASSVANPLDQVAAKEAM